ncbi:hypothetical protein [Geomonas paludis]|uniref:Uncharacterized protein n=1 Tax=Geomonas paludis TaxID=2740185 RepID=A0A6V8MQI3_9BACT|nr:hypothetical protein [Geomonas paludis]GFO62326.1 hypothetical protein GMPD_02450 [Geomonas paludis]
MITIRSLRDVKKIPEGPLRKIMEEKAALCHGHDKILVRRMEEEFDSLLGGNWYVLEEGDDPRKVSFDDCGSVDLLGEEWNWCEVANMEDGYFFVFWSTNNAGGPCLFVRDEPWLSAEVRARLEGLVALGH